MFGYMSLLVEGFFFDAVEMNFLIVGHTHASIDQYFSVIAKAIRNSHFIGTPVALMELIRRCNLQLFGSHQQSIVREILVYYDIKKAFAPYLNSKIKYYNLPLNFRIQPSYCRTAIMQYRNACTNPHWLPSQAPLNKGDNNGAVREYMTQLTQSVVVPELAVVNGRSELFRYFGLGTASTDTHHQSSSAVAPIAAHDMLSNSKQVDTLNDLSADLPLFQDLSFKSVIQQEKRMLDESEGIEVKRSTELRKEMQRSMIISIEEANRLSQLLVRKGDNVDPTQEIVKYGMRNTGWVAAQLARAKNKSSQKKKKKGETVEALITAATAIHDGKCDVLECTEEAVGKCNHYSVSSTSKCSNRSYCTLHIAHTSHDLQTLKVVNKVRFLFTMPTEYSYDYTSLFSAADNCR
jgi:hypothetical protein